MSILRCSTKFARFVRRKRFQHFDFWQWRSNKQVRMFTIKSDDWIHFWIFLQIMQQPLPTMHRTVPQDLDSYSHHTGSTLTFTSTHYLDQSASRIPALDQSPSSVQLLPAIIVSQHDGQHGSRPASYSPPPIQPGSQPAQPDPESRGGFGAASERYKPSTSLASLRFGKQCI